MVGRALAALSLAFLVLLCPSVEAQPRRPSERVVLDIEVVDCDTRPAIYCGVVGSQPRDFSGHVLAVVEGHYEADTVLLTRAVCGGHYTPDIRGERFRVAFRRYTDVTAAPTDRYRIRSMHSIPTSAP